MTLGVLFATTIGGCSKNDPPSSNPPIATSGTPPVTTPSATPSQSTSTTSASSDSIDKLVKKLSASPLWRNGLSPQIDLSEQAPTKDVVAKVFASISFDQGKAKSHTILLERQVKIGDSAKPYTAVLVDTNVGRKIVLLQYEGASIGWWSRAYPEE